MRRFGWSYPPGVTGMEPAINGGEGPCDVCGLAVDNCICPECPVCGSVGDTACYESHGMTRTQEQIDGHAAMEAIQRADAEAEWLESMREDWM